MPTSTRCYVAYLQPCFVSDAPFFSVLPEKNGEKRGAYDSETAITYLLKRIWPFTPLLLTYAGHHYAPPTIVGDG